MSLLYKMTILFFISVLYSTTVWAQAVNGDDVEEILMNSIFEELLEKTKGLTPPKHLKKTDKKSSVNKGSRGKQIIEEMKKRNREKLARLRGVNPSQVKSGKDLVKLQKKQNKELIMVMNDTIKNIEDWQSLAKDEIQKLKSQIFKDWKKKHALKIKEWDKQNKEFYKNRNKYGKTTFELPLILNKDKIKKEKPKKIVLDKEYTLTPMGLSIPIRDQKYRPTCGSFAGIRSIETKLFQKKKNWDLSEQYFYWASKKECRYKKCARKGSWVGYGLNYSKEKAVLDIPLEFDCKYQAMSKSGNETQIPLQTSCKEGRVQVTGVEYFHSMDELVAQIQRGNTVVASMRLTPNFYSSRSVTLYKDRLSGRKMDSHAAGHSFAIVGFVKLPKVLEEGRVCFIVANSWGKGWGKGGHSCISELWLKNQKQVNPFVAVTKVRFNNRDK